MDNLRWEDALADALRNDAAGRYDREDFPERWPIMGITWYEAVWYANWLSEQHGYEPVYEFDAAAVRDYMERIRRDFDEYKWEYGPEVVWNTAADGFRLPTEAEWQYAAIGGQANEPLWGREDIDEYAWLGSPDYALSTLPAPKKVGQKKPNALGLYDVIGLADEWVWNYLNERYYEEMPYRNPTGPVEPFWDQHERQFMGDNIRIALGCSFWTSRHYCIQRWQSVGRAASRAYATGLRLARGPVLDPDGERQ